MQTHSFSKKTIAVAIAAGTALSGVVSPAVFVPSAVAADRGSYKPVTSSVITDIRLTEDSMGAGADLYESYTESSKARLSDFVKKYVTDSKKLYVTYVFDIDESYGTGQFDIHLPAAPVDTTKDIPIRTTGGDSKDIGTIERQGSAGSRDYTINIDKYPGVHRKGQFTFPISVGFASALSPCGDKYYLPAGDSKIGTKREDKSVNLKASPLNKAVYLYDTCTYQKRVESNAQLHVLDTMGTHVPRTITTNMYGVETPSINRPTVSLTQLGVRVGLSGTPSDSGYRDVTIIHEFDKKPDVDLQEGSFSIHATQHGKYSEKLVDHKTGKTYNSREEAEKDLLQANSSRDAYVYHYTQESSDKTYTAHGFLDRVGEKYVYTLTIKIPHNEWADFDTMKSVSDEHHVTWKARAHNDKATVTTRVEGDNAGGNSVRSGKFFVPLTPANARGEAEFVPNWTVDAQVNGRSANSLQTGVEIPRGGRAEFSVSVKNTGNIGLTGVHIAYPDGVTDSEGKTSTQWSDIEIPAGGSHTFDLGELNVGTGKQANTFTVTSRGFETRTDSAWTIVPEQTMADKNDPVYPTGFAVYDHPFLKEAGGAPVWGTDYVPVSGVDLNDVAKAEVLDVETDGTWKLRAEVDGEDYKLLYGVTKMSPDDTNGDSVTAKIRIKFTYKDGSEDTVTATVVPVTYERYVVTVEKDKEGNYLIYPNWREEPWKIDVSDIRKSIEDNKAAIDKLKAEDGRLQSEIDGLKKRVKDNEDAIKELDKRVDGHDKDIKKLVEKTNTLRKDVDKNTTAISTLTERVTKLEGDLNKEIQDRKDGDNALQGQIDTLEKDVNTAKETLSKHEKRITELENRVAKNEGDITTINKQIGDINAEISSIKTDINNKYNTLNTMIGDLDKRVTNNTEEINNLKTRMTKVESDIIDINNRIDGINIKIGDIENKLNKEIQDRKDGDNKLSLRIDGVDKRVTDIDARVTNLTNVVNEGNNVNKEEITKIKNEISSIKNDITSLRNDVNKNTANITNLDKRVTEIEGRVTNVENRVTNLEGRVGVLESTNKKWAQCYSGIGIAALPALLSIPLWGLGNAQIPAIQQFNTDVQKQIGMFNPELAAFVENTGAVQIIATILGVASAIGLVAYAANECRPYNETSDAKDTPLGSMSSDMYQAFDPDGKGSSDADADTDADAK